MNRILASLAIALTSSIVFACGGNEPAPLPPRVAPAVAASGSVTASVLRASPYPKSEAMETVDTIFGSKVSDPYRWLEDEKAERVTSWLDQQDKYARSELAKLPGRDALKARLKELLYVDSLGIPRHRGARYFFSRKKADQEKAVVYVRDKKGAREHVLLDPNTWSKDGSSSLGTWVPSHDGKLVAYTVHENNSDEATLFVLDVTTGKKLEADTIVGAKYATPSWTPKGDGFVYTWLPVDPSIPSADRPGYAEVRFHSIGKNPKDDPILRGKTGDPSTFIQGDLSHDGHFLFLLVEHGWTSSDVLFRDLRTSKLTDKNAPWAELAVKRDAHFSVDAFADNFYVLTDEDAPQKHVFKVSPAAPSRDKWQEIIKERKDATIEAATVVGGKLMVIPLVKATNRVEVHDLDGKILRELALPGLGSVSGPVGLPEDDEAFFTYQSYTEPTTIFSTSMKSGVTTQVSKVDVPFDPKPFVTEQIFYPSRDGTKVSMFLVHKKDLPKDGSGRVLLYGYGGFLATEVPYFTSTVLPWLEAGGIYAIPNLRGGGEYGEAWHRAGMKDKKQNVFDDYIAAAETLIRERYTSPSRIAIYGDSNGGLLVGAAMTQRPDLFGAVICGVPLLDMVRYHLSGGGKTWISEYGSPDVESDFRALFAYSPYHHVKDGTAYPPLLMLSADADDRVDPMHARKFVAAVQARSVGGPVLLRVEKHSGHGGADLRRAEVEKGADRLAFAMAYTSTTSR